MKTLDFLRANEVKGENSFISSAQYVKDNWQWLKYSYAVAVKVRRRMQVLDMTQKQLSEALGCSQQHVSVLLNGKANMTLETIAKLETALQCDLIGNALLDFQYPVTGDQAPFHLSSPNADEAGLSFKTSRLVSGYTPRKKKGPKKTSGI